jgi:hypothetical protein
MLNHRSSDLGILAVSQHLSGLVLVWRGRSLSKPLVWRGGLSSGSLGSKSVMIVSSSFAPQTLAHAQSLPVRNNLCRQPGETDPDHRGQIAVCRPMPMDVRGTDREDDQALEQVPHGSAPTINCN